ncbi:MULTISPECIES: BLUF domain-containing protein [unclassified Acidovorax]|uniref:BLUF domain-containing protein n=1 Tax=unclassified Acidovorax TaxID=2684926 RepID=UPI002882ED13|nr:MULTISPECIES: BLUF domain-containing protein [unclassified Acidovorax]
MSSVSPLYEILYISTLSQGQPLSAVAHIAGHARWHNQQCGITGLLVFDGQRFGQQIEGPELEVRALLERIRSDPRHIYVEVLHDAPLAARRFQNFSLGFSTLEDDTALERLETLRGPAALRAFVDLPIELE